MKVGGVVGAGASALGAVALLGCGSVGDRATSGCPEGEVCSTATPDGLRFYGASLEGTLMNGANAMAVGGTQRLRFEDARTSTRALPTHTTVSSAPEVISVSSSAPGSVVLEASAAGEARIRVVEPSGPLLDRITVRAAALERVRLAPSLLTNPLREVAYTPGMQRVGIALQAADGTRLVDEGAVIDSADVRVNAVVGSWDVVTLDLPRAGAGLTVVAAGRTFDVEIPVAGPVDDIALNPFLFGADNVLGLEPLAVYEGQALCFDLLSEGRSIIGYTETVRARVDGVEVLWDSEIACLALPEMLGETVTIEVTAGSVTRSFTAEVRERDTSMSLVSGPFEVSRPRGTSGERASLLRGLVPVSVPVLGI